MHGGTTCRTCSAADAQFLAQYLQGNRTEEECRLISETFAVLAWDAAALQPVGFISIDDVPAACNQVGTPATAAAGDTAFEGLGYKQSATAYVQQLQAEDGGHIQRLLQHAFSTMPQLQQLLLLSCVDLDLDLDLQQQQQSSGQSSLPAAAAAFLSKVVHSSQSGLWLYECNRQVVLPQLQVRNARVEDHDDLLPILAAAAAGPCPSLAALPESCQPDEPFALTRLIGSQDSENLVLAAEDDGKLVGLLVATCQLDLSLLYRAFDLGSFDAFLTADTYEECESAARHAAEQKAQQQKQQEQQQQRMDAEGTTVHDCNAEPTADQIQQELVPILIAAFSKLQRQHKHQHKSSKQHQKSPAQPPHSLVAVTMLCMLPGFESRAVDFMQILFDRLPGKVYCALTLPHSAAQPELARHMVRLQPLPGSAFPQVVFLLHKASLELQAGGSLEVRLAVPDDVMTLHGLIGTMSSAMQVQEAFLHAVGRQGAVLAHVNGELVGTVASSPCSRDDLVALQAKFNFGAGMPPHAMKDAALHARLDVCVINPVFAAYSATMLADALRLLGKACFHYILKPGEPVPSEVLAAMQQQKMRHSSSSSSSSLKADADPNFALFSFTKAMAYSSKQVINAQVVVAGASETGLACLERLLLQPSLSFSSLTLLAPGGVNAGGGVIQLPPSRIAALGLHANATLIDGHLVAVEPAEHLLMLADGKQLPYDLLVMTTGLQDQLGPALVGVFPDAAQFVLSAQQLMGGSIPPELADSLGSVLVYGADLQALDVLAHLTEAGVNADGITWVCPGVEQEAPSLGLLRSLAAKMGLELPEPQQGRLLDLVPTTDGSRAVAALQAVEAGDDGPVQQMELDLCVGCGRMGPSAAVAGCMAGANLVWDGRLVVNAAFCSSDTAIMGAGPVAKFSRRYTLPEIRQEQYNSSELGACLADSIIAHLAGTVGATGQLHALPLQQQHEEHPDCLPALRAGKVISCKLPGGLVFAFAGCPAAVDRPQIAPPKGGCSLVSKQSNSTGVFNICLDAADTIYHVAYLGKQAPRADQLSRLVGLPFSYLAAGLGLPDKLCSTAPAAGVEGSANEVDGGPEADEQTGRGPSSAGVQVHEVPGSTTCHEPDVFLLEQDVLAALSQPWAQLLFHQDFSRLQEQLLGCVQKVQHESLVEGSQLQDLVKGEVQLPAVNFIQRCCADMSGYRVLQVAAKAAH